MTTGFSSTEKRRFYSAAIWVLLATVALLLVVPQVDFPDAVNIRSTVLASRFGHAAGPTWTSNIFAIVITQTVALTGASGLHIPLISFRTSAHQFLILHCSLRC
jgi:hypothetical protein